MNGQSVGTVSGTTYQHYVWTDNNGVGSLYINGAKDGGSFNYAPGGTTPSGSTVIGGWMRPAGLTWPFTGYMDEVRVATGIENSSQITTEYQNQLNGVQSFTVGLQETNSSGGGGGCVQSDSNYCSGNWQINCSKSPTISTTVDLLKNNITWTGTGVVTVQQNIINVTNFLNVQVSSACYLNISVGKRIATW